MPPSGVLWMASNCKNLSSPLQPLSPAGWWIALHVHVELQLSDSPAACLRPFNAFESVTAPPHSACTRSTRFYSWRPSPMRYFHAKCFSLALSMQITPCSIEAVAAVGSIVVCCRNRQDSEVPNFLPSQKSRCKAFTEWRMYDYIYIYRQCKRCTD